MSQWERFIDTFFNRAVIVQYLPDIYHGILITLELSILIVVFGILLGMCLAVLRVYKILPLSFCIIVFADVFRALPPLVLILIAFLAALSIGATGSLVSGTSGVFNKVQGEVFQETSSEVLIEGKKLYISINQKGEENAEKIVIDCLNFYAEKYPDLSEYTCDLVVRKNLIIDDSCNYLSGLLSKKESEESITLDYNTDC